MNVTLIKNGRNSKHEITIYYPSGEIETVVCDNYGFSPDFNNFLVYWDGDDGNDLAGMINAKDVKKILFSKVFIK